MRPAIINSPFYSLDTHYAGGVVAQSDRSDATISTIAAQVIDQFHDHAVFAQAYAGWSAGLAYGWVATLERGHHLRRAALLTRT